MDLVTLKAAVNKAMKEIGTPTDEQVGSAVNQYLTEHPVNPATAENIRNALGYTPADNAEIEPIKSSLNKANSVLFPADELTESIAWHPGYFNSNGTIASKTDSEEIYSDFVNTADYKSIKLFFEPSVSNITYWVAIGAIKNGTFMRVNVINSRLAENTEYEIDLAAWDSVAFTYRTYVGKPYAPKRVSIVATKKETLEKLKENVDDITTVIGRSTNYAESMMIKSINHRGFRNIAPENTASAFALSAKNGFKIVETDIQISKDGQFVLCHDATVDRTSNGSGSIAELTLAQLKSLDFGSWKSPAYAGEKILTLDEFLMLCKKLGIMAYIELSPNVVFTQEQCNAIAEIVKKRNMLRHVTWISQKPDNLKRIINADRYARVGYISFDTALNNNFKIWSGEISKMAKPGKFFLNLDYRYYSNDKDWIISTGYPLEVWTVNTEAEMLALDDLVSGCTSDNLIFADVLKNAIIGS